MTIQNKNKIKIILSFSLLIIILGITFYLHKISNETKEEKTASENTIIPTPDRIIYKNQNNEYIIISPDINEYSKVYSELNQRTKNAIEGKVYSEDEINQMKNEGSFVEFDYNTKSKNYIFMLEENEIGIIKYLSDSGQVIQTSIADKEEFIKNIEDITKDIYTKYDFDTEYNYNSKNELSKITNDLKLSQTKTSGVYQKIIKDDENEYNSMLKKLKFESSDEMQKVDFNKQNVIITVSRYEIKDIKKNIGNVKYELGKFLDKYMVNVFVVSKVVNVNCIYFNTNFSDTNVDKYSTNENEDGIEYYVQNGNYYTNINDIKTQLISLETAIQIAEKEAKKEKYQYQGWKSEFYCIKSEDDADLGELICGLDDISRNYHWNEAWKYDEYKGKIMWKIRLFDKNDPLTSLYIYIDAISGKVIGAGQSSD